MNIRLLPVLAVASLVAACGGQPPAAQSPAPATSAAAPPAAASASSASPAGAAADASLPDPIAAAIGRVRGMLEAVDDGKIKEAFSPDFLAKVPPAQVTQVFTDLHKKAGACSGQLDAKLVVDANAPYLIQGLLMGPPQD